MVLFMFKFLLLLLFYLDKLDGSRGQVAGVNFAVNESVLDQRIYQVADSAADLHHGFRIAHASEFQQLAELSGRPVSVLEESRVVSLVKQIPVLSRVLFQLICPKFRHEASVLRAHPLGLLGRELFGHVACAAVGLFTHTRYY